MGWFEEQVKQRKKSDQRLFEESIFRASSVVMGKSAAERMNDERIISKQAIDDILKYYHYTPVELPGDIEGHEDELDYSLRPHGLMKRRVTLDEGWYNDAYGPILAYEKDTKKPCALLPGKLTGYYYNDRNTGKKVKLNKKIASSFECEAYCFYRPFPLKKLHIPDLMLYMKRCVNISDITLIVLATVAATIVGMLMPRITKALTGPVLSSGSLSLLISTAIFLVCTAISTQLISSVQSLYNTRLQTKINMNVQSALMMRVLGLPAAFFRKYSSGELHNRSQSVNSICTMLSGMIMGTGLTSLMSLAYITQIFSYAPALVTPSLIIILITVLFSTVSSIVQIKISKKQMELSAKESGMSYSMISGIQKIKLSGAEKRFFSRWLNLFSQNAELTYAPPMFVRINSVINLAITLIANIVLYFLAVKSGITQSDYYAFTAAYSSVMGAFSSLAGIALSVGQIKPYIDMAKPFLETPPEITGNREMVTEISGSIRLDNVYFRYNESIPYVINNLSLNIKSGEYVAIVGKTGCGKSTLMRLLLGFEVPEKGAVYYDGRDVNSLDLVSLRKNIGSVMQNGSLMQGDIYSNIVISAPHLGLDEAWEAAEIAGIADDIRDFPMGMNTLISEGGGDVSGGQKQRLMIARAIVSKPKLMIFDEATSALDNLTQKKISDALDKMDCTRIIIAHRLSTIRNCDRILVFDKGMVTEEGTYDELVKQKGYFADLVSRQRLDS